MTSSEKTKILFQYYFRLLGLYVLFFVALGALSQFYPELMSDKYEQTYLKELLSEKPLQLFILAVILAPIIEEMMFRTLIKPSHSDLILLCCSWPIFYINRFIPVDVHWLLKLAFIATLLFTTFYILRQLITDQKTKRIRHFLSKHYRYVLVVSSLIFGLVHINNYVEDFVINAALVALIVPRVLSGFMLGLIKVKNKHIVWSMSLHAINNGVVIGVLMLAKP